jgi:LPXTG-motif cell wall-anchored protein
MAAVPAVATAQATPRVVTIQLGVQNASGVTGTATLTDVGGGRTRVDVRVAPGGNTNMPAHIHDGTCATLNPAPKYPLTNVANGTSTTEVSATIAQVLAAPHAINLHKSPQEASVYVSCGNVVAGAALLPSTGGPASAAVPALAALATSLGGLAFTLIRRRR